MPFGRITDVAFDGRKKSGWLMADINCLVQIWVTMAVIGTMCVLFVADPDLIDENVGWMLGSIIAATFIPPFVLVFVLRRNFSVTGPRRQFRYICPWL